MTAKCHPAETVWDEGHGGVPAMGVVRLLGKQQPDKQYRLAPITETAAQATEAKGQKGKIAKRIFFPAALNCDSVLLLPKALPYRFDGVTSLAVLVGEAGVAPGVRILDPIIGLAITFEETVGVYGTDRLRSSWT